jgi:hypothetical protein
MTRLACAGLVALLLLSGCRDRAGGGHLELRWKGSARGTLAAPATADWCALLRLLEIRSVKGDTGVAIALYPTEALVSGTYPVKPPAKTGPPPPAARLAVRWPGQTAIRGFQGDSGTVVVERSAKGVVSGRVTAFAHSATDTGALEINGRFRDLVVQMPKEGCVAADTLNAPPIDTLVH